MWIVGVGVGAGVEVEDWTSGVSAGAIEMAEAVCQGVN